MINLKSMISGCRTIHLHFTITSVMVFIDPNNQGHIVVSQQVTSDQCSLQTMLLAEADPGLFK